MIVRGVLHDTVDDNIAYYAASAPADRRVSFTGSGLAFGNVRQAFAKTPNSGETTISSSGQFSIELHSMPNAYYDMAGSVLVPPTVFLLYKSGGVERRASFPIAPHGSPYRLLNHPQQRRDATFYSVPDPVRGQEEILWDSKYPCSLAMPANFWDGGKKPPL